MHAGEGSGGVRFEGVRLASAPDPNDSGIHGGGDMSGISRASNLWRAIAEGIGQDLRYAIRLLPRNPGFAAVAIVSLALGIGANSAVFSLLNAVALRELDAPRPDRLVSLTTIQHNGNAGPLSFPMFEAIARDQRAFSSLIGEYGGGVFNIEANGTPRLWTPAGWCGRSGG